MANVVIVSKHMFMNDNGIDYAMAVSAADIIPFSNMDKAIAYVEEQINTLYADECKFDRYDYTKDECFYQGASAMVIFSQQKYNGNKIRHAYNICKKKVE